jgi:hypothetical protein
MAEAYLHGLSQKSSSVLIKPILESKFCPRIDFIDVQTSEIGSGGKHSDVA